MQPTFTEICVSWHVESCTGAPGPQGGKGDRGDKGEKGERGERGEKGELGHQAAGEHGTSFGGDSLRLK